MMGQVDFLSFQTQFKELLGFIILLPSSFSLVMSKLLAILMSFAENVQQNSLNSLKKYLSIQHQIPEITYTEKNVLT